MIRLVIGVAMATTACTGAIMNQGGIPYTISNPTDESQGVYSTDFTKNVDGPVDYFDVYGEVQTKYSQVYWTRNHPVDLPPTLVKQFAGKVMAITGYEVDQVTHTGPMPGYNSGAQGVGGALGGFACYPTCSDTDVSVPIYHAYNHHYFGWLKGADAEVYTLDHPTGSPNPTTTGIRDLPHDYTYPTNLVFKENPGGEYRKSYHGYPSGYALLLHSPEQWVVEPMQIDTHNRKYDLTSEEGFKPSFLPAIQNNNMTDLQSKLSPLIECPCSDRITKTFVNSSTIINTGTCTEDLGSLEECNAAIASSGITVAHSAAVSNTSLPAGCILTPYKTQGGSALSYAAIFNSAHSSTKCDVKGMNGTNPLFLAGRANLGGLTNLTLTHDGTNANITMSGPAGAWFGVGLDANAMKDLPYALVVDDQGKVQERRLVNHGPGAVLAPQSITVVSSTVADGIRTVVVSRPVVGPTADHYTLPITAGTIPVITALGNTPQLAYHSARTGGEIVLLHTEISSCICAPKTTAYVTYMNTTSEVYEVDCVDAPRGDMLRHGDGTGRELPNNACGLATYHGGLHCCKNSWFLTDLDQASMISNATDVYFLKWRYYFQEYTPATATTADPPPKKNSSNPNTPIITIPASASVSASASPSASISPSASAFATSTSAPASHQHLHHWVFLIDEHVNDYEEDNKVYGEASMGKITANLTGRDMGLEDMPKDFSSLIFYVMTPHCHAPNCIREELWNADTGELICGVTGEYGSQAYGSTNMHFNEANYLAIPPCIWGYQDGLKTPPTILADTNIMAVKYFNNTYRHLGQMAQWTGMMKYETDPY